MPIINFTQTSLIFLEYRFFENIIPNGKYTERHYPTMKTQLNVSGIGRL